MRDRVLWIACAAYAALMFALGAVKYEAHRSLVDLGIFTQTAASAFGCFCNPVEGSHWAFHFSPVLYIAGALVAAWHSPLALTFLQAVAGALVAPPVYALVRERASVQFARLCAFVALLYPPLAGVVFNDFHENGLAPAAVLWLLWAFATRRFALTVVFAIAVLAVKEDQALFLACASLFAFGAFRRIDPPRARLAAALGIASLSVFALFFFVIQPHANANPHWSPTRFYAWTSADFTRLPAMMLSRAGFFVLAFLPLLFLPFRVPAAVLTLPPLAEVLASRMSTTYTMGSHYAGAWIGYALFAFALAMVSAYVKDPRKARRAVWWCVSLCVLELVVANPMHPRYFLHARTAEDRRLDAFLQTLEPQLPVATQEEAYAHLAARNPNATLLPENEADPLTACYVLVDEAYPESVRLIESRALLERLRVSGELVAQRRDGEITLYKRRGCR